MTETYMEVLERAAYDIRLRVANGEFLAFEEYDLAIADWLSTRNLASPDLAYALRVAKAWLKENNARD